MPPKKETPQTKPILAEMVDEEEKVKKCCSVMKEDVHVACRCCAYTWCCTLNSMECCCVSMSKCCTFFSSLAMGCNNFLEEIDCDKH